MCKDIEDMICMYIYIILNVYVYIYCLLCVYVCVCAVHDSNPRPGGFPVASHLTFLEEYRQARRRQKAPASKCIPQDGPNKPDTGKRVAKNVPFLKYYIRLIKIVLKKQLQNVD